MSDQLIDFDGLLDALGKLNGEFVGVVVGPRTSGPSAPAAVFRGLLGRVEMSGITAWYGERGLAFFPVLDSARVEPSAVVGPPGFYVDPQRFSHAQRVQGLLTIFTGSSQIQIHAWRTPTDEEQR
ncbi:MAG: hypothetical protein M3O76_02600 [Actinomycetota bacterium]|nr:hypothetical protein [Actinomycetota bacterium]